MNLAKIKVAIVSLLLISMSFFIAGCKNKTVTIDSNDISESSLNDELEEAHLTLIKHEQKLINQYIRRHELKLISSSTGLRYKVYKNGLGNNAQYSDLVQFKYKANFINGVVADSTQNNNFSVLVLEQSEAISGLHELLSYMNKGAKAIAVVPSFLAYGFSGEQGRIPKGATMIYDVEVVDIIKFNNKNHTNDKE